MKKSLLLLVVIPNLAFAQLSKTDSLWLPLQPLIGKWTGTGDGVDGKGAYERSYQFVLSKKYIELKNKTVYPATKEKPKGYIHEDYGYISYDKARKTFIFRQFHGEGFVTLYTLDISSDGKTLTFMSESIENIPAGWRAREIYTIEGANGFTEDFNLAEPDKDFEPYTKASFTRKK